MSALMIAELKIKHRDWEKEYASEVRHILKKYRAKFLVFNDDVELLEGNKTKIPDRIVVLEFPTKEAAQNFYRDENYLPMIKLRQTGAETSIYLVEALENNQNSIQNFKQNVG